MKVLVPGHEYLLDNFENKYEYQIVKFINKKNLSNLDTGKTNLETVKDGTTNEEILRMLIDRLEYLYRCLPSKETKTATFHIKEALSQLESRTRDRIRRNVEGKHEK